MQAALGPEKQAENSQNPGTKPGTPVGSSSTPSLSLLLLTLSNTERSWICCGQMLKGANNQRES